MKEPLIWPNSSDSNKSFGIAAQLMAIKGPFDLDERLCRALAASSFPVPDSPLINTVTSPASAYL